MLLMPPAAAQDPRVVTIEEAIEIARTRAAVVRVAELDVSAREAELSQARASQWPSLQLSSFGSQRYGLAFDQTAGQLTHATTEFAEAGIGASWTVFDGFARRANIASAVAGRDAAQLRRARAEEAAVHQALGLYYAVATAKATLDVVRANVEVQQRQLAVVEAQIEAGIRPASEIYLQQERLAEAELRVLEAGRAGRAAELQLLRHLALDPLERFAFVPPDTTARHQRVDAEALVEEALTRRADMRAYGAALASAAADRRAASAHAWPTLTLVGNVGTTYSSTRAVDFSEQITENRSGVAGLRITLPLFDQGQRRTRARLADVRLEQLEVEADDRRREVMVEVLEAAQELRVRAEEVHVAERRAVSAAAFLAAEQDRYQHGVSTLAALAEANARHVEAQVSRVQARYALAVTQVLLDYRTGKPAF